MQFCTARRWTATGDRLSSPQRAILNPSPIRVLPSQRTPVSKGQGSALLLEDVAYAEHSVEHLVTVTNKKRARQGDDPGALISFKGYPGRVCRLVAVLVAVRFRISSNILRHSAI
jgi:hypothetical protein